MANCQKQGKWCWMAWLDVLTARTLRLWALNVLTPHTIWPAVVSERANSSRRFSSSYFCASTPTGADVKGGKVAIPQFDR
ncbi:MAG: hypothetical protein R2911_03210 [Caldilineaceae bacterium]